MIRIAGYNDITPHAPHDALCQPLAVGNIVLWAAGRSAEISIGKIVRFNFKRTTLNGYSSIKCEQAVADSYSLTLQPLASSTGYYPANDVQRTVTVQLVSKVVRLDDNALELVCPTI